MEGAGGKTPITPEELQEEGLYGLLLQAPGATAPVSVAAIDQKLRAAEDHLEKQLHIRFQEKRVVSNPQARGLARDAYDLAEVPYDLTRTFLLGDEWGYLQLRERPVQQIDRLFISAPGLSPRPILEIPGDWLIPDGKRGTLQIIPGNGLTPLQAFAGVLASYVLGRTYIPRVVYVDYRAGFSKQRLREDHNDLLEAVRLYAVLLLFGVVTTIRTGGAGSQSLSFDGFSRNESLASGKYGPYTGQITLAMEQCKELLQTWVQDQQDIPLMVLGG